MGATRKKHRFTLDGSSKADALQQVLSTFLDRPQKIDYGTSAGQTKFNAGGTRKPPGVDKKTMLRHKEPHNPTTSWFVMSSCLCYVLWVGDVMVVRHYL
jgi:hypothetical protein